MAVIAAVALGAQETRRLQTDWASHNLDLHNGRFSPLDQINTSTVGRLAERWAFQVAAGHNITQVTPLVVDGMMYLHAPSRLFALNAVTGEAIWTLEPESAHPSVVRGPTYGDGKVYIYNGSTLIAADAVTGELPVLFDVTHEGETIKGVGAAGKNCLLYLWHRETGEPIHPMVETVVPTDTNVPGEQVWPTQPIPHNGRGVPMTPFCATYVELDDPAQARRSKQIYTPYSVNEHLIVAHGGASFGSPAFSPRTGLLYVTGKIGAVSLTVKPVGNSLEPGPDSRGHTESIEELDRILAYAPTLTVTAYDPASGEQAWQHVRPALSSIGSSGNLVTAGDVLFQGTDAGELVALHAATGELLFRTNTTRAVRSSPITYQVNGTQYVTVVATDTVRTYALP